MRNCFTVVYKYLSVKYSLPTEWNGYTQANMDDFVKDQKRFLARKDHIAFFKSFCSLTKTAKKDDIVLTRSGCGVAINQFMYWIWNEDRDQVVHKKLNEKCLIMRINNG